MSINTGVLKKSIKEYRRRKPQYSPYYQCIEDYYEEFKGTYDRKFSQKYGYLRSHIKNISSKKFPISPNHQKFSHLQPGVKRSSILHRLFVDAPGLNPEQPVAGS